MRKPFNVPCVYVLSSNSNGLTSSLSGSPVSINNRHPPRYPHLQEAERSSLRMRYVSSASVSWSMTSCWVSSVTSPFPLRFSSPHFRTISFPRISTPARISAFCDRLTNVGNPGNSAPQTPSSPRNMCCVPNMPSIWGSMASNAISFSLRIFFGGFPNVWGRSKSSAVTMSGISCVSSMCSRSLFSFSGSFGSFFSFFFLPIVPPSDIHV